MSFHRRLVKAYPWLVGPLLLLAGLVWARGPRPMLFLIGGLLLYVSIVKLVDLMRQGDD